MGDFTSQDRERSQKTITLLEQHIKLSDERHVDLKETLKTHNKRIAKNETMITKVMTVGSFVIIPLTAGLTAFGRKFFG